MVSHPEETFPKLVLAAGLDQFFGLGLGQLGVVAGLHSVVTTALGLGTQVGSVAEHLRQVNVCVNLDSTGTGDLTQNVRKRPPSVILSGVRSTESNFCGM